MSLKMSKEILPMILILGATGHVGRETVIALSKDSNSSNYQIRAGVKDLETERGMMDSFGIEAVHCDFANKKSLEMACDGVQRVFLILANVPERVQHCKNVIEAALKSSSTIEHFVFLSIIDSYSKDNIMFAQQYRECEELIEKSGIPYTHLRSMFFQENIIALAPQICSDHQLKLCVGNGRFAPVALEDVGEAACNLLLSDKRKILTMQNKYFDLTGPELLSGDEIASIISHVSGKEITFSPISVEEMAKVFGSLGYSEFEALGLAQLYNSFSKNEKNYLSHDLDSTLLQRKSTMMENSLNTHKSHFTAKLSSGVVAK